MKIDYTLWPSDGQLGSTNITIPTNAEDWPKGDALVQNFVYQNGKLVGFVDTKALVANESKSTTFPYDYVNITVDKSLEETMTFNPGERTKVSIVTYTESGNSGDTITFKYKGCKTVEDVIAVDPDYKTNDIVDGVWTEGLGDLESGDMMFYRCNNLTTFTSDLPSLTDGDMMFCGSNLSTFDSDLSSLTNGEYMFSYCRNLTAFTSDLSSLTNGMSMFYSCSNLSTFDSDLSSLTNVEGMFYDCSELTTFTSDLSSLTNGYMMFAGSGIVDFDNVSLSSLTIGKHMFRYCYNLTTFISDLSSLTDGTNMFSYCDKLVSFTSNLKSLENGYMMFYKCTAFTAFTSDLSSLTNGDMMFNDCSNLTDFTSDLSSLTNGRSMFYGCSELTTFTSDLSSLTNGDIMFSRCKLNTSSIQNIAETIKDVRGLSNNYNDIYKIINIDIGNTTPTAEENTYLTQIYDKGWEVYVRGSAYYPHVESCGCGTCCASLTTLDENGEETSTPIPFWAKPVPATEETAKYVDADGNFYNILGGQFIFVDDPDTYGMFTSEEDAAAQMRLKKIGEEEIETA